MNKNPIIITGSGRSGTFNLHQFLKKYTEYAVQHELQFDDMLKLGVMEYVGFEAQSERLILINNYFKSAIFEDKLTCDVSNAGIWCVQSLKDFYPETRFFMVIRNGYKVVSSFYNKFSSLMYPENNILEAKRAFDLNDFSHVSDKTFWRPLPTDPNFYQEYKDQLRFAILCWYWVETINRYEKLERLFAQKVFRFEDIVNGVDLERFCTGVDVKYENKLKFFFEKPTNIENTTNYRLSSQQEEIFEKICGDMMSKYYGNQGYYDVKY